MEPENRRTCLNCGRIIIRPSRPGGRGRKSGNGSGLSLTMKHFRCHICQVCAQYAIIKKKSDDGVEYQVRYCAQKGSWCLAQRWPLRSTCRSCRICLDMHIDARRRREELRMPNPELVIGHAGTDSPSQATDSSISSMSPTMVAAHPASTDSTILTQQDAIQQLGQASGGPSQARAPPGAPTITTPVLLPTIHPTAYMAQAVQQAATPQLSPFAQHALNSSNEARETTQANGEDAPMRTTTLSQRLSEMPSVTASELLQDLDMTFQPFDQWFAAQQGEGLINVQEAPPAQAVDSNSGNQGPAPLSAAEHISQFADADVSDYPLEQRGSSLNLDALITDTPAIQRSVSGLIILDDEEAEVTDSLAGGAPRTHMEPSTQPQVEHTTAPQQIGEPSWSAARQVPPQGGSYPDATTRTQPASSHNMGGNGPAPPGAQLVWINPYMTSAGSMYAAAQRGMAGAAQAPMPVPPALLAVVQPTVAIRGGAWPLYAVAPSVVMGYPVAAHATALPPISTQSLWVREQEHVLTPLTAGQQAAHMDRATPAWGMPGVQGAMPSNESAVNSASVALGTQSADAHGTSLETGGQLPTRHAASPAPSSGHRGAWASDRHITGVQGGLYADHHHIASSSHSPHPWSPNSSSGAFDLGHTAPQHVQHVRVTNTNLTFAASPTEVTHQPPRIDSDDSGGVQRVHEAGGGPGAYAHAGAHATGDGDAGRRSLQWSVLESRVGERQESVHRFLRTSRQRRLRFRTRASGTPQSGIRIIAIQPPPEGLAGRQSGSPSSGVGVHELRAATSDVSRDSTFVEPEAPLGPHRSWVQQTASAAIERAGQLQWSNNGGGEEGSGWERPQMDTHQMDRLAPLGELGGVVNNVGLGLAGNVEGSMQGQGFRDQEVLVQGLQQAQRTQQRAHQQTPSAAQAEDNGSHLAGPVHAATSSIAYPQRDPASALAAPAPAHTLGSRVASRIGIHKRNLERGVLAGSLRTDLSEGGEGKGVHHNVHQNPNGAGASLPKLAAQSKVKLAGPRLDAPQPSGQPQPTNWFEDGVTAHEFPSRAAAGFEQFYLPGANLRLAEDVHNHASEQLGVQLDTELLDD